MIEEGLVAEVKALKARGYDRSMVAMQGLGYKEILDYLDGACTLEDAIYKIKRDTRHFAKRQITWFKREKHVTWINKKDYNYEEDRILEVMLESVKKIFWRNNHVKYRRYVSGNGNPQRGLRFRKPD